MTHIKFHNDTSSLNQLWYDSHKNLIASVLVKLGHEDKMDEICKLFLGDQHKLKQLRDPNKPKRAKSGYLYFCDDKRVEVMEALKKIAQDGKNIRIAMVSKKLGGMWSKLNEDDRVKYNKQSLVDKERYETEMENYNS